MANRIRSVRGLVAMVTGGANGLGRAVVQRLVDNGARVVVADLPSSSGAELVETLGSDAALFTPLDVTSEADVISSLESVKSKFGRLDALVNVAGVGVAFRTYNFNKKVPHQLDDFQRVVRVNLVGSFNVSRLAVGLMGQNEADSNNQRGLVIHTSSISAYEGQSGQAAYAASKAGLAGMVLPMARDLADQGIRVVGIAPGLFDSPLLGSIPDKVKAFMADTVPCPSRLGAVEEFAHAVQFLVENGYMNGEVFRLDGGVRFPA